MTKFTPFTKAVTADKVIIDEMMFRYIDIDESDNKKAIITALTTLSVNLNELRTKDIENDETGD